jgi:uncharacterized protein YbaP (TraB family)
MSPRLALSRLMPAFSRMKFWHFLPAFLAGLFWTLLPQHGLLAAERQVNSQGLLWEVSRDGGPASYVFGTIHVTDARVLDLPEAVRSALAKAQAGAFELDHRQSDMAAVGLSMILTDGRKLEDLAGKQLFDRVAKAGKRYGLLPEQLQLMKPWGVMLMLNFPPQELSRVTAGKQPLDLWLQSFMLQSGKEIHGLESFEEQISIFDEMQDWEQVGLLEATVEQNAQIDAWFERLISLYLSRDLNAMYELSVELSAKVDPRLVETFERQLLFQRNKRMVARMIPLLDRQSTFVAVGALHLPGTSGILHLLELQGYKVKAIY